jgi:tRNA:m4X modification enzyme
MTTDPPSAPPKRPAPNPGQCGLWLPRKSRYCRLNVQPGRSFCCEHLTADISNDNLPQDEKRIPCAYDPTQYDSPLCIRSLEIHYLYQNSIHSTVMAKNMKKHLKICNGRPIPTPPYHQEDVNLLKNSSRFPSKNTDKRLLSNLSEEEWTLWLERIDTMYDEVMHDEPIETSILTHSSMSEKLYVFLIRYLENI